MAKLKFRPDAGDGRALVLDTETTGFSPKSGHRVVEVAITEMLDGRLTGREFHCYINPRRSIPREASDVHGLTAGFLANKPFFGEVARDMAEFIGDPVVPIYAHNASFDARFMKAEFERSGLPLKNPFLCSLALAKALPIDTIDNKLATLAARIGYVWGARGAHSAIEDTRALAAVLSQLLWPLEREQAALPQPERRTPSRAPRKAPAAPMANQGPNPRSVLPKMFEPLHAGTDDRIRRYDDEDYQSLLGAKGQRWTSDEEVRLLTAFVIERKPVMDLVADHGRTPAALFLRLENLGAIVPEHPYARTR